ncbi:unnamed protein product [Candidula unifasciata]|uniref:FLYWCH-type domain-containing protein n=1 Tax=Candidula unifasciata TaxID=100452 RepID=A0A8S3ZFB4_9EUPU|nr:unnamed protein product [Candidula unifasciata]
MELEKLREKWRENNLKNSTNEEEPCLPSFETVRTAMYNSRNAVLSAVSLRATEDEGFTAEVEPALPSGPSRSTRSRDTKSHLRQKTTPSKTILCSPDLDDLDEVDEEERDDEERDEEEHNEEEHDEEWKNSPPWKSSGRRVSKDITFYFLPSSRGSHVLVIDGCVLYQNTTRTSGMSYWRCQKKGCFFRAVYDPIVDKVTKTAGLHSHPPDSNQMLRRQFINNVKSQITENPHLPAKQIYEKEVQKVHQELDGLGVIWKVPPFSSVKHHIYKAQHDASKTDDEEEPDEDTTEDQVPIKREITETEKKFLEESAPLPQEEETRLNSLLLSPGPTPIHSTSFPDLSFYFIPSKRGKRILVVNEFTLRLTNQKSGGRYYWKCTVEPCMFRCVYNGNLQDLVKVSGKHTHASNVNRLRIREFYSLIKARMAQDPSLSPKKAYDQEVARIRSLENGEALVKCLPAYSSIRTSLYNQKRKKVLEDEQKLLSGRSTIGSGYNNYYTGTSVGGAHTLGAEANLDQAQDISPKDITQLSLEDNDPMEHEEDDRGTLSSSSSSSNPMEIAAPSLYDNHDIIGQYCSLTGKSQSLTQEEKSPETHLVTKPDLSVNSVSFLPTARGGRALVVNGCMMRINYTRDYVTYWKCPNTACHFRCSYDSKRKHLIRISGEHNHPVSAYNSVIRIFVQKLKKRVSQENKLSPKIIYDEEVARVKSEETDVELLKRLPTYDSLKSTLYKVKKRPAKAAVSVADNVDYLFDASEDEKQEDENCTDTAEVSSVEEPPYDPCIEEGFSMFNSQLPSWIEQDPDKRLLDGHLLVKKSTTETSTGWSCSKEDCPFRCVVDIETNAITRSQWDHTHKSVVKQIIAQTMLSAVRRRAVMDYSLLPTVIYKQERKRIIDKLSGNKTLIKFIPNLTQVYQLITKTRANPRPPQKPTASLIKHAKQMQKKKCSKASGSNVNIAPGVSCTGAGHFDADCLLEQGEDDGNKLKAYPVSKPRHQQRGLTFKQEPCQNLSSTSVLDRSCGTIPYQQPDFDHTIISFRNAASAHVDAFTSVPQQSGCSSRFSLPDKSSHYVAREPYLHQQVQPSQQQESSTAVSASAPPLSPPLPLTQQPAPVQDSPSIIQIPHSVMPDSEFMFLLHGYPVKPTTTSMGSIYWQCQVLGCGFHCLFNTETSQIVKASGSHNHAPTGSQSAFSSQVVKVLQKKAIENLDQPLSSVYWEYVNSLRHILQSEEIMNSLPRFQDVMSAMQSSRTAMGADDTTHQIPNLIVGSAVHSNRAYEFHYDAQLGSLIVSGDILLRHWRMNEMSYWRCKQVDCRFKCVLDDELQCVHILNTHTHPCPSYAQEDDRHYHTKRKSSDKPSLGRLKIPRIE